MSNGQVGYQPRNTPAERRAFFDLRRKLARLAEEGGGGGGGGGANEVTVGESQPTDESEIWIDPTPPTMYAKIGGSWVPVSGPAGPAGSTGATGAPGAAGATGPPGAQGAPGVVQSVVAGTNVTVDSTNPAAPIVSASGGVQSVNGETGAVELDADEIPMSAASGWGANSIEDVANYLNGQIGTKADKTTTIATTAPLTGGGDLSANRTLAIDTFTTALKGAVPPPGTVAGKVLSDAGTWIVPAVAAPNEVVIATADPIGTSPEAELWYDTDAVGADVDPVRQWNAAWGVVGTARATVTQAGIGATYTQLTNTAVTFTAIAGRRYSVTGQAQLRQRGASGGAIFMDIYDSTAATSLREVLAHVPNIDYYKDFTVVYDWTPAAGTRTLYLRVKNTVGTVDAEAVPGGHSLRVEDVGPVSGFAPAPDPTPAWIPATLVGGWVNYTTNAAYRKIGDMVQLRGSPSSGTTTIFNLPVGYRPPSQLIFGVDANNSHGRVDVFNDGRVYAQVGTGWFSLNGIQFSVTP